jgi:hypothetical protein
MVRVYVLLIQKGLRTIEQVPTAIRETVRAELAQQ